MLSPVVLCNGARIIDTKDNLEAVARLANNRMKLTPPPGGGAASAERTAGSVALIPSRASHQLRSCAADRGAGKSHPSGGALEIHG